MAELKITAATKTNLLCWVGYLPNAIMFKPEAIRQDFHAKIFTANLAEALDCPAHTKPCQTKKPPATNLI
ncbi:hypothetical protein [Methyloglobulus sp.]|uniref:hypothetical protein n=1 Tax=Methyloglobulus sp. TaxID=2518622 RepID=UPI003989BD11